MGTLDLKPGEYYFGTAALRLTTLLGSCVALTMWHPGLRQGGMCHYLLPGDKRASGKELEYDGRYAESALAALGAAAARMATPMEAYEWGVFGGGSMFPEMASGRSGRIGCSNIQAAQDICRRHGLRLRHHDVGGSGYRKLALDLVSGQVDVSFLSLDVKPKQCIQCKNAPACFSTGGGFLL